MTQQAPRRPARIGRRTVAALSLALALLLLSATAVGAASAITLTKRIDKTTPQLNNFADGATLSAHGRLAHVSGTIDCVGGLVRIRVEIRQGDVVAEGHTQEQCTPADGPQPWSAIVITRGAEQLHGGDAAAHAWATMPDRNGIADAYDWGHAITLQP